MKFTYLFAILLLSLNAIIAQTSLRVDYVTIEGLEYFKSCNLSYDNPNPALKSIIYTGLTALSMNSSYSVINKTVTPPNGNKHEYISYARNGSDVEGPSDPIYSEYMVRDVLSLSISYQLYNDDNFADKAIQLLNVWFVNESTNMLPEVNYGQMNKTLGDQIGREEGILDTRLYVYVPTAVKILKKSHVWNDNIDIGLRNWFSKFSDWLINSELGKKIVSRSNNLVTFYVAQLATYLDFSGRTDEAKILIKNFTDTTFQDMILESGEQPMESTRPKPYYYQCFNLEALTYIALLSQKINGTNLWETKTKYGATIQNAIDYLVPLANQDAGQEDETILLPALYKAKDYYGDQSGKYTYTINKLLKETNGVSEWWTVYSPKSLSGVNITNSNNKPYTYETHPSDLVSSATLLFRNSIYSIFSLGFGIFFIFLL